MSTAQDPVIEFAQELAKASLLPPLERARRYRALNEEARGVLAAGGDAAINEALDSSSYQAVADELGLSTSSINKAVTKHRARLRTTT